MGNLYTQVQRRQDQYVEVLSKLKQEWGASPRDFKKIDGLQKELNTIKSKRSAYKEIQEKEWSLNKAIGDYNRPSRAT